MNPFSPFPQPKPQAPLRPKLGRPQRVALARLMSDLVEADFIVEEGEMTFFEQFISTDAFRISTDMLAEAKQMSFAKAVELLKGANTDGRKIVLDALRRMAMADGTCVPLEAIQLLAVEQALEQGATVYSVPAANVGMANMQVIYVEGYHYSNTVYNIWEDFRPISHEFALAGFDFVTIPRIVSDFKEMDFGYLLKAIHYMNPSATDRRVFYIAQELFGMTTANFCRNLLDRKLALPLSNVKPSLLIKIGESDILEAKAEFETLRTPYANFLLLPLQPTSALWQVQALLDHYRAMVSGPITVRTPQTGRKFLYYGFHRTLFDLIAYGPEPHSHRLVFDFRPRKAEIYFETTDSAADRIPLKLNPQEAALYYLIVRQTIEAGGLDWRDSELIPAEELEALLADYNRAYARFGKGKTAREYKERTQTSRIRTQIKMQHTVFARFLYIPEHARVNNHSVYRVRAEADSVEFRWPDED